MVIDRQEYIDNLLAKRWNGKLRLSPVSDVVVNRIYYQNYSSSD